MSLTSDHIQGTVDSKNRMDPVPRLILANEAIR